MCREVCNNAVVNEIMTMMLGVREKAGMCVACNSKGVLLVVLIRDELIDVLTVRDLHCSV
jgi:hypothetical protein